MPTRKELLEIDGREVTITNPDKVFFPRARLHQAATWSRYYLARRRGRAARRRAAGRWRSSASSTAPATGDFFFQKRAPDVAARLDRRRSSCRSRPAAPPTRSCSTTPRSWPGSSTSAASTCNPHPVRADDLDHPDELRVDLDPMPGRGLGAGARGGAGGEGRARRRRPDRLAQDLRLARHPHQRAHRAALDVRRGAPRGAGAGARGGAARARPRHQQVVEGGAPRRLPRLQPERQGPHRRVGVLGAADAGRARLDAARAGTRCRPSRWTAFTLATVPALFADARRRRTRASTRRSGSLEALLELSARARGRGARRRAVAAALPQAGGRAAARAAVAAAQAGLASTAPSNPSRSRARLAGRRGHATGSAADRPDRPAAEHDAADRDRARRQARRRRWPGSSAGRRAIRRPRRSSSRRDVLVDSMRGRFTTWTRIRVNLRTCPRRSARRRSRSTPTTTRGTVAPMQTAAGYLRKSRSDDESREVSREVQERAVRDLASRDGHDDLRLYVDWDRSGDDTKVERRTEYPGALESAALWRAQGGLRLLPGSPVPGAAHVRRARRCRQKG